MSLMTGSLDNLATELINAISAYLDNEELLALAMVSKRLHVIALTFFIKRHSDVLNTVEGSKIFLYGQSFPLLKPLRMALFIRHVSWLDITFLRHKNKSDAVLSNTWALQRFISHLTALSCVEFGFDREESRTYKRDRRIQETMGDLLEALIGKDCLDLRIRHWNFDVDPLVINEAEISVTDSSSLPQRAIRPLTSLKRMTIRKSELRNPELCEWLLKSMNLSQIETLTLSEVSFFAEGQTVGKFLECLILPSLTRFDIIAEDMKLGELVDFLLRHESIESLDLGHYWTTAPIYPRILLPIRKGLLPHLKWLKLDPVTACYFLASHTSLPLLSTLVIQPKCPFWIDDSNDPVISRCLEPLERCFTMISYHQSINYLNIVLLGGSWSIGWLSSRIEAPAGQGEPTLAHINQLAIACAGVSSGFDLAVDPMLVKWLARFPALQKVMFLPVCFARCSDRHTKLREDITKTCPTVLSVEFEEL